MTPSLAAYPALQPLLRGAAVPFEELDATSRQALLEQAMYHGLLAAVEGKLPTSEVRLRARLERATAGLRLRAARAREVLAEVVSLLAAGGTTPVALKGPVLAERLYPDAALRPSSDLDLLVSPEELPRAVDALLAAGFRRADPLQDAYQLRRHHHLHLHRAPGPDVELHFRALSACGATVPTAELLARAGSHRTAEGVPVRVLSPEDELLTLAVHAAGHAFLRLGWLLDLILFLREHPSLDWDEVGRRARAYRCRRTLAYTCEVLRELGAPVPAGPALALPPARRRLADRLAAAMLRSQGKRRMALHTAYQHALRDRAVEIPGALLVEAGWVIRRRVVRLQRRLRGPAARAESRVELTPELVVRQARHEPEEDPAHHEREDDPSRPEPEEAGPARPLGEREAGAAREERAGAGEREQRSVPGPFWQLVRGRSMLPTLREGDEVLLESAEALAPGDVVVLRHPTRPGTMLHRIVALEGARVVTQGDGCRAADPPARRGHVLFRAVALRREGQVAPIPPLPARRALAATRALRSLWRRLAARSR